NQQVILRVERVRQLLPTVRGGRGADTADLPVLLLGDHAFPGPVGDDVLAPEVPLAFGVVDEVLHDLRGAVPAVTVRFVPEDAAAGQGGRDAGDDAPSDVHACCRPVRDGLQVL